MDVGKTSTRSLLMVVFVAVGAAGVYTLTFGHRPQTRSFYRGEAEGFDDARFAPKDDLEEVDLRLLDAARETVDIAMYAFTDEKLAQELLKIADRGVRVRLYRDGLQLSDEESRATKKSIVAATDLLAGNSHIQIKVKASSTSMHLKAYCVDGAVLRTGSANWSQSGEHVQDNDLYVIRDQAIVKRFEADFNDLWLRTNNGAR